MRSEGISFRTILQPVLVFHEIEHKMLLFANAEVCYSVLVASSEGKCTFSGINPICLHDKAPIALKDPSKGLTSRFLKLILHVQKTYRKPLTSFVKMYSSSKFILYMKLLF